jgi:hypothetical protein
MRKNVANGFVIGANWILFSHCYMLSSNKDCVVLFGPLDIVYPYFENQTDKCENMNIEKGFLFSKIIEK